MPIDTDCAEHTGYDFEQSHFSELDNDSKHRGIEYPCQVARLRASIMTAFNTTPLMHLTRRRKVAFSLAVVVTVLLFFATLHRFGFDRSWARLSSSVTHSGPNEAFGKPKPSDPEPTICSSWPDVQAPIISRTDDASHHKEAEAINRGRKWTKPAGFKIVAVIFYGRRRTVDVLDCYLQKNLVHNGGFLDAVQFLVHTHDQDDVAWIRRRIYEVDGYEYVNLQECTVGRYGCIWNRITANDTLYIKIDDDIVYIHDDAIPQLVKSRQEHTDPLAISANVVNTPRMAYLHHHHGAIYPYLPAVHADYAPSRTWRTSELPLYDGEKSFELNVDKMPIPFLAHRWLPVSKNNTNMDNMMTPIGQFDLYGKADTGLAWRHWAVAAQQHYSLLQHIEADTTDIYHFGIWNTQWTRYNLNFAAIWGADVQANLPIADDDEGYITAILPQQLGRPIFIDTKAVVSHLHFGPQTIGMLQTDVLDRYRALANDRVCATGNQKRPFDESCDWVKEWERENAT